VKTSVANLHWIYYIHKGSPINWIVVPPKAKEAFEAKIREVFGGEIDNPECSQFIDHLSIWIHPRFLNEWQIDFYTIKQQQGQILIVWPGSYIWGWASGWTILEKDNYASKQWSFDEYKFCNMASSLCRRAHPYPSVPMALNPANVQGNS
jgi:hypothetical protein